MIIFKNYLKVTKNFLPIIIVYSCIFIGIAMLTTKTNSNNEQNFEASEASIAIINRDVDSSFVRIFQKYIKNNANYVELKDNEQEMRDALFFRRVDYIMIIPEGFSEAFEKGIVKPIETMDVPDAFYSIYSKNLMNKYLNTASLYLKAGYKIPQISQYIEADLNQHINVTFESKTNDITMQSVAAFYNFSNYTLISVIIVVVAMVMIAFKEEKVNRRQLIAPLSSSSFQMQLVLGNIVTSLGVWLLYVVASLVLYKKAMLTINGLMFAINALMLTLCVMVFSIFLTTITKNRELVSGISTVAGLGTSFIAGAFVPQELLSNFVLNISKLTPSYWFIRNNNMISRLTQYTIQDLTPLGINFLIILGFTIIFYGLTQYVHQIKYR